MKLKVNKDTVGRIELLVGDTNYVITEEFGEMRIHLDEFGSICVQPCCSNEVLISIKKA